MTELRWIDPDRADAELLLSLVRELKQWEWRTEPCAVCGEGDEIEPAFVKHEITMCRCKRCGNVFVSPAMPPDAASCLYSDAYWERYKRGIGGPSAAERLGHDLGAAETKMRRDVIPFRTSGRLLDVGASTGALVARASAHGFDAVGVEPSRAACRLAELHLGIHLHVGTLDDAPFQSGFDIVTLHDVLEHVPQPRHLLSQIHCVLVHGGLLAVETPTTSSLDFQLRGADWPMVLPLEHLNLLNERNGAMLLREAGFQILDLYSPHEDNWIAIAAAS